MLWFSFFKQKHM